MAMGISVNYGIAGTPVFGAMSLLALASIFLVAAGSVILHKALGSRHKSSGESTTPTPLDPSEQLNASPHSTAASKDCESTLLHEPETDTRE